MPYEHLTFDIETASDWDETPQQVRDAMVKRHQRMKKSGAPEELASLSPYTGKIVCATLHERGLWDGRSFISDMDETRTTTWIVAPVQAPFFPGGTVFCSDEQSLLTAMLNHLEADCSAHVLTVGTTSIPVHSTFTTFYGYRFDLPFVIQRLRKHKFTLGEQKSLLSYPRRYVDLADTLSLNNHLDPRLSLDAYCTLYGVESPKGGVIENGAQVEAAYANKQYLDLVQYNRKDTVALDALTQHCRNYMNITGWGSARPLQEVFESRTNEAWPR